MAKWMDTFFLTVITVLVVIMSFFYLHSPEKCGPGLLTLPFIYMLLFIAWVFNRHFLSLSYLSLSNNVPFIIFVVLFIILCNICTVSIKCRTICRTVV